MIHFIKHAIERFKERITDPPHEGSDWDVVAVKEAN